MTFAEQLFLVLFIIIPITVGILTVSLEMFYAVCGMFIFTFFLCGAIDSKNSEWKLTSEVKTVPIYFNLGDNGLDIVTDDYKHYKFTDHQTIVKYQKGLKFYKTYYYKQVFGLDEEKQELILK